MKKRNAVVRLLLVLLLVLCLTGCTPEQPTLQIDPDTASTGFRPDIRPMPVIFLRSGDNTAKVLSGGMVSSSLERIYYGTYEIKDGVLTVTTKEIGTMVFQITGETTFEFEKEKSQIKMFDGLEDGAAFHSIGYIEGEDVPE